MEPLGVFNCEGSARAVRWNGRRRPTLCIPCR